MNNKNLETLTSKFTKYFDGMDSARENAFKQGREISKCSAAIIRRLHNEKIKDLSKLFKELDAIKDKFKTLKSNLRPYPDLYYSNMLENFVQEYVEATVMLTLIKNNLRLTKLPDPDNLGVRYSTYLLGLGDVIGELRRCTLDSIRKQNLQDASEYLDAMEQIFDILISLNYPDGVLPLRRKQDVARSLIEKTRSELAFAVSEYSLKENITDLKTELKRYQNTIKGKRKN